MRGRARALAAAAIALACACAGCATGATEPDRTASATPARAATCSYPVSGDPARPVDPPDTTGIAASGTSTAVLHLSGADVTITLDQAGAPCTSHSFESLAAQGFYDNTQCHRLVDTGPYILQCGDPTATGRGGPGYTFADELTGHEKYPAGTVAMANLGSPDTNGSQFFFVWEDSDLPPDYTIFGHLDAASLEVIQRIAAQGVSGDDGQSPIADATISSVTLG